MLIDKMAAKPKVLYYLVLCKKADNTCFFYNVDGKSFSKN